MKAESYFKSAEGNLKYCRERIFRLSNTLKRKQSLLAGIMELENNSLSVEQKIVDDLNCQLASIIKDLRCGMNNGIPTNGDFYSDMLLPDRVDIVIISQSTESQSQQQILELKMEDVRKDRFALPGYSCCHHSTVDRNCCPSIGFIWYVEDRDTGKLVKWRANYDSSD